MFLKARLAVMRVISSKWKMKSKSIKVHSMGRLLGRNLRTFRSKSWPNYDHLLPSLRLRRHQTTGQRTRKPDGKDHRQAHLLAEESWGRPEPIYELSLQDIDELQASSSRQPT